MKVVIALFGVVLLAAGWWLRHEEASALARPTVTQNRAAPIERPMQPALPWRPAPPMAVANPTDTPPPQKLALGDEALRKRLDEVIPGRLSGEAARCYKGGLDRSKRIDLTYRLHVEDSRVIVREVRIGESTLGDRALEDCIRQRVASMTWRDPQLPDIDEEDNLYLSVRQFKSFTGVDAESSDGTEPGLAQ
jgi:hypothetical protein